MAKPRRPKTCKLIGFIANLCPSANFFRTVFFRTAIPIRKCDKCCEQSDRPVNSQPERKHSANEIVESQRFASELCIGSVELCSLGRVCGLRKICQTGRQDELFSFCNRKSRRSPNTEYEFRMQSFEREKKCKSVVRGFKGSSRHPHPNPGGCA